MELPTLDSQCSAAQCSRLDFLPFRCSACCLLFCLEHRTAASHDCKKWTDHDRVLPACAKCNTILATEAGGDNERLLREHVASGCTLHAMLAAPSKKTPCALEGCSRAELWSAKCRDCHRTFCLGHRHPPDHGCPVLAESRQLQRQKEQAVQNLRAQFKPPATAVSKAKKSSPMVELMKLKGTATGDKAVPLKSRVFFWVHFPCESNQASQPLFFHKDWTVGRAIDAIANHGKIVNRNNEASPETRLSLYHGESGTIISTTTRFIDLMAAPEKTVANGQKLILERGGMEFVDPASYAS